MSNKKERDQKACEYHLPKTARCAFFYGTEEIRSNDLKDISLNEGVQDGREYFSMLGQYHHSGSQGFYV